MITIKIRDRKNKEEQHSIRMAISSAEITGNDFFNELRLTEDLKECDGLINECDRITKSKALTA